MNVLVARGLSKTLTTAAGPVGALKNFSAEFAAGRSYAVVGPSGCGKSTLLYLLGLLDTPTSGEISINGLPTAGLDALELAKLRNETLGFVFQFHYLLPELTVEENLLLPLLKAAVMTPAQARARVVEVLEQVGLTAKLTRSAGALSGGEQQRVAVARALVNRPKVILADEPTGNLDHANSEKIFALLQQATHSSGAALIMVTHNTELANRCDESITLLDGQKM